MILAIFRHRRSKGGAVRRFLRVKESWERERVGVFVLENKPMHFDSVFTVPTLASKEGDAAVEFLNNLIFAVFASIYGMLSLKNFRVVLCPNNDLGSMLSALLVSKLRRKRSVVYVHHFEGAGVGRRLTVAFSELYGYTKRVYGLAPGILRALAVKVGVVLVAKFDASICVSSVYARIFSNSHVSTNGVGRKKLELISKLSSQTFEGRPPMACYIGRLSLDKGVPDLLKAWKRVATRSGREAKLVLAGFDEIGINRYINSYDLRSSVEYRGIVGEEEKFEILSRCRVYVTASKNEGWNVAVSEALLSGTPAVCYNTVTLRRQWGDCPYVFLANHSEDFVNRIFDLINGEQRVDCQAVKDWTVKWLKTFDEIAQRELKMII